MSIQLYLAFVVASAALIAIPGPNVALIVANSLAYGTRYGLLAVVATTIAGALQLSLTILGLSLIVGLLAGMFEWIRWIGVGYLVYLGARSWRMAGETAAFSERPHRVRILSTGFLVSLTNPKTLLFYSAFLPQFVDTTGDVTAQLALLGGTVLSIAVGIDTGYALAAGRLRAVLALSARLRGRITGAMLLVAGAGLALARRP